MIYNGITFNKLSFLEKYPDDPVDGIPKDSGVYYWVYFPNFDPKIISTAKLNSLLKHFSRKSLKYKEDLTGKYKFQAEIKEQGYPNNGELFGLSPSKSNLLKDFLNVQTNKELFHEFFIEICFSRPFYVGKANNLRDRIANQHFKRIGSDILNQIDKQQIDNSNIWVGYKRIPILSTGDHMNVIFEEILSRTVKPGLTKKPN